MTNFFGDPSVCLNIALPARYLIGDFECGHAVPLQGREVEGHADWTSSGFDPECSGTRIVHGGPQVGYCGTLFPQQVYPITGQRMLRITGRHQPGPDLKKAAWTVFQRTSTNQETRHLVELGVAGNRYTTILSFWVYQDDPDYTPGSGGISPALVELITDDGRYLSDYGEGSLDQHARPYEFGHTKCPPQQWKHRYVRLSDWAADVVDVDSVVVRYRGWPSSDGGILVCLDDVYVGDWTAGTVQEPENMILNGLFTVDTDGDSRPDFWTGYDPEDYSLSPDAACWTRGALLPATATTPAAISQILPRLDPASDVDVHLEAVGPVGSVVQVVLQNLDNPAYAMVREFSMSGGWRKLRVCLSCQAPTDRHCLTIQALGSTIVVDSVYAVPGLATGVREEEGMVGVSIPSVGPTPSGGVLQLRLPSLGEQPWTLECFAVDGRRVFAHKLNAGDGRVRLSLDRAAGRHVPTGVYYLRLTGATGRHESRLVVVR